MHIKCIFLGLLIIFSMIDACKKTTECSKCLLDGCVYYVGSQGSTCTMEKLPSKSFFMKIKSINKCPDVPKEPSIHTSRTPEATIFINLDPTESHMSGIKDDGDAAPLILSIVQPSEQSEVDQQNLAINDSVVETTSKPFATIPERSKLNSSLVLHSPKFYSSTLPPEINTGIRMNDSANSTFQSNVKGVNTTSKPTLSTPSMNIIIEQSSTFSTISVRANAPTLLLVANVSHIPTFATTNSADKSDIHNGTVSPNGIGVDHSLASTNATKPLGDVQLNGMNGKFSLAAKNVTKPPGNVEANGMNGKISLAAKNVTKPPGNVEANGVKGMFTLAAKNATQLKEKHLSSVQPNNMEFSSGKQALAALRRSRCREFVQMKMLSNVYYKQNRTISKKRAFKKCMDMLKSA